MKTLLCCLMIGFWYWAAKSDQPTFEKPQRTWHDAAWKDCDGAWRPGKQFE